MTDAARVPYNILDRNAGFPFKLSEQEPFRQKLFDPDGGFSHFITRLSQLIWLNILFLVCSLPVVTFGASSAALYTVLLRLLQGEDGHLTRRFFSAWRDNWKRASGCWLLLLIVIAVCGADLWLAQTGNRFIWKVLAVFALQLVGMVMTFLFPLRGTRTPGATSSATP